MGRHNAFTFPYTFFREPASRVIPELQEVGFTGINLALNYHASRDFLLRQGPALEYPADGFHYYQPNRDLYPAGALTPNSKDALLDNQMLVGVLDVARSANFDVNAWAVFMHNSALGYQYPQATVTNCFGNHFLSELCPSSPAVAGYIAGLTHDLSSRGISSLAIESLHFHGAHHGEHHERFFLEMSAITAFLFSLCFCSWCIQNFSGDGKSLQAQVAKLLQPWLDDRDSWLGLPLTRENLGAIVGGEILEYLAAREELVASRYQEISAIAKKYGVGTRFIDQAPLLAGSENSPLDLSWQVGIDNSKVDSAIDYYEPLIYRKSASEVAAVAAHYRANVGSPIAAILRPTFPDNENVVGLTEKVSALRAQSITDIDFYLLDAMRPRDLGWIKRALTS